jgi:hypothetical protein
MSGLILVRRRWQNSVFAAGPLERLCGTGFEALIDVNFPGVGKSRYLQRMAKVAPAKGKTGDASQAASSDI